MVLLCILLSANAEPVDSIIFKRSFDRITCFRNELYAAPLIGKSIFKLDVNDSLQAITFTNEVNYQIRDFRMTPFAIYINRGSSLDKYYISAGIKETVFMSGDISSFDLSPDEEIVFADRKRYELIFLDFAYRLKFKIENILAEDLRWHNDLLYVLTKNAVHTYDEHGNLTARMPTPEFCNKILVVNDRIMIYTERSKHFYLADTLWQKKELPYTILDVCENRESIIVLDGNGTTVRIFERNNF